MQVKWFFGCKTEDERKKRSKLVAENEIILDLLSKICYNSISETEKTSIEDYENPSWSHRQADRNGYVRCLQDIIKMCELKDK